MKISGAFITLLSCVILVNGTYAVSFLEPNCGTVNYGIRFRIIGGETANILEHPWMAFISSRTTCKTSMYSGPGWYCISSCGGSLITARYVLSAAHCDFNPYTTAKLGEFDSTQPSGNGIEVSVEAKISHPHYSDRSLKNDIALYRLAQSVRYSDYIKPVCLPTNYNPLAQTTYLTATGWGTTEYGQTSNVLKRATLTQLDRSSCRYRNTVDMSQICAGGPNSNTCFGDSGGPITALYPINGKNRAIQLGVVSFGDAVCHGASVYTNVMHYMGWITNVVRQGGYQTTPAPFRRPNNNNPTYNNNNYPTNFNRNPNPPTYYNPFNYLNYG